MKCKECGKEIEDGKELCLECEMKKEYESVVKLSKADIIVSSGKYQAKFFDYQGYVSSMTKDIIKIVAVLASIATYVSVFLTWQTYKNGNNKSKATLISMGSGKGDAALSDNMLTVYAAVIIVGSIFMLVMTARDNIRPLRIRGNFIMAFIPPIIALVGYILVMKNKKYIESLESIHITKGVGPSVCLFGILIYMFTIVAQMIKSKEE